jgi:hypothetical protein
MGTSFDRISISKEVPKHTKKFFLYVMQISRPQRQGLLCVWFDERVHIGYVQNLGRDCCDRRGSSTI